MGYKRLFIWVEGQDDIRFFNRIIKSILEKKYELVEVISYANMSRQKFTNFLKTIKAMNASYIYVTDINNSPCISAKKEQIHSTLKDVNEDRIHVVIKEIESWYLAGLSNENLRRLKIRQHKVIENITKEQFNNLIPKKFDSRIDFMWEILKSYSIKIASQNNRSFKYLVEKYN